MTKRPPPVPKTSDATLALQQHMRLQKKAGRRYRAYLRAARRA